MDGFQAGQKAYIISRAASSRLGDCSCRMSRASRVMYISQSGNGTGRLLSSVADPGLL